MAIKKTELYSSLWASCDELRGGMDASQYKDYVLTLLFVKYISDKYEGDPEALIEVPEGCTFQDIVALMGDPNIGEKITTKISEIAKENGLQGIIDVADFNDEDKLGKDQDMVDRLSKLVGIFNGLDLRANRAEGDDLLGDAYEYLMRNFATESGKSKGQFYTPAEVSRILAKVIGIKPDTSQDQSVYDPTCGSGSLLLKVAGEAPRGLSIFGQERDTTTAALARMNMILHDNVTAEIWKGNTLAEPHWKEEDGSLRRFDFAVANPPFSYKSWSNGIKTGEKDQYKRFKYGTPPEKNGDYAFLLHIIKSLNSTGKAAVILPHGVLSRGNAEETIRQNLLHQGYIKGIIGLPANLFYGTGIPACIIVIDKEERSTRKHVFMIDASHSYIKDGNKNRLRSRDIHKIVDVFNAELEIDGYSRKVPLSKIAKDNNFNLNIPRYIDASDPEDRHDLHAHMNGGIPKADIDVLQPYWNVFPELRRKLFTADEHEGYRQCLVSANEVKLTILRDEEFKSFFTEAMERFNAWSQAQHDRLMGISLEDSPKELIATLSEALLERFADTPLMDKYAIYQILMDYWEETMQDDAYILTEDGWEAGQTLRQLIPTKDKKGKKVYREKADFEVAKKKYKADLIPPTLIVQRYFSEDQANIDTLQTTADEKAQDWKTLVEENSGEDNYLEEAKTDKGSLTQKSLEARIKVLKDMSDVEEEFDFLKTALNVLQQKAKAEKAVKDAQKSLDAKVFKHYPTLDVEDIKALVVKDKWNDSLKTTIKEAIERITQQLASRIQTLEERYAEPLPQLMKEMADLSKKVEAHLKKMEVQW